MPPKKRSRRTARIIRTSSPDHHDARASTTPEARRTRSGRRFAAPSASSPVGTRGRKPRASRRPNLGPSPVEVGRKRKVFVVESEDSDQETGRARRRRRGNGPNTLTHISDQNNRQELAGEKDDFVFTGVGTARGPKVVNFPWDFSIPVSQLGKVDQHIECFAHVEDDDLKSVLKRVGCDAVVRKREQLIKLVLAFGPLIEGLPDSGRTAPNESEPLSHGADLDQSQHPAPTPAAALQVSQGPSGRSYNREQAQQEPAIPNHTDLIDWGTPDQGPAPPNNGQQNRTAVSPTSPAIRQSGEDAIPATTPGLTPDLPGQLDSDETQTGSPLSLSYLDRGLKGIQKLLAQQSQKISALQEDASLTIRHQRDMLEILGQISEKVETGSTKRTASSRPSTASAKPKISRQGRLKYLIELHFQALFGLPPGADLPPPPPTAREKRFWLQKETTTDDDDEMETDIPDLNSDHDSENSKTGSEVDDPQFPYRGGPGHPDASQETLKIMHEMLQEKGMRRFRLDVSSPLSATDNRFCLNVARNIFVQLVECGEYDGLKPDEKDPENILRHLTSYAKERFFRKYRERTTWTSEQQAQKTKSNLRRARRINLIKLRQETAVEIGGLEKFRSIIDKCTSDDETDDEAPVASTSTTRNERLKFCKVRLMAWRSEDVKKAMILLDQYREEKQAGKPNKRIGVQPRIRRRADQNVVHSKIEPPEGSSRDIYDKNWLELQNQETILSLKISSRLVMPGVLQVLNRAIPQN